MYIVIDIFIYQYLQLFSVTSISFTRITKIKHIVTFISLLHLKILYIIFNIVDKLLYMISILKAYRTFSKICDNIFF